MSWEARLLETVAEEAQLTPRIDALLAHQRDHFEALRAGEEALARVRTRVIQSGPGGHIFVQLNAKRRKSTHAKVDPDSVSRRPCFLCPDNIPDAERGIAFGDFVVLPNPYPVLRRHCTIPARDHIPQALKGYTRDMLKLARALGPEMLVFYNGSRCGASAPDHLHFQACDSDKVELAGELPPGGSLAIEHFGRRMLRFAHADPDEHLSSLENAIVALAGLVAEDQEPMFNLLSLYSNRMYQSVLFPRARHRPERFFAPDTDRIAVSPAALEMAGILVVAEPDHFDRIDTLTARAIYEEVTLDEERFARLREAVT
jgi:hypothetical protein